MTHIQLLLSRMQEFLDHESPDVYAALDVLEQLQNEMENKVSIDFRDLCELAETGSSENMLNTLSWSLSDVENYMTVRNSLANF